MSGRTEEQAFKKTHQVVGEGHGTQGDLNDALLKNSVNQAEQGTRSADESRQHDIENKGYTNKASDQQLDEMAEMKAKLESRGNAAQ